MASLGKLGEHRPIKARIERKRVNPQAIKSWHAHFRPWHSTEVWKAHAEIESSDPTTTLLDNSQVSNERPQPLPDFEGSCLHLLPLTGKLTNCSRIQILPIFFFSLLYSSFPPNPTTPPHILATPAKNYSSPAHQTSTADMADVQEILKKKFGGAAPARTGMS